MKKILLLSTILLFFISCKINDIDELNSSSDLILVKRMTSSDSYNVVTYNYDGNKIVRMGPVDDGSFYLYYTYEGNLITKIGFSDDDNKTAIEYDSYIYSNSRLIQIKTFYNNELQIIYDYTYLTDGSVEIKEKGQNGNSNSAVYRNYYDTVGNQIKHEYFENNTLVSTTEYTFDNKNNPFKNIIGYSTNINNILSIQRTNIGSSTSETVNFVYQYNSDNYPTTCLTTKNGNSISIMYYYD